MALIRLRSAARPAGAALLALAAVLSAAVPASAATHLVTTEWLQQNLSRKDIRIVDMRVDLRDYWESHLPQAVFLDVAALRWPDKGVPVKLMPPAALAMMLGALGIGRDTTVIIYSEINHYRAAYFAWALDVIGHPSWAILEGGFQGWKKEGRPTTQDYPALKPVAYPVPSVDPEVQASLAEVRDRNTARTVLIDARPAELYAGERGNYKRDGHIKGAVSHFWASDLLQDGRWRNLEALKESYASIGATPDKVIYISCGQGLMSSHEYVTLKYVLGFPRVKNYDGGFSEWSAIESLPVEKTAK